jgi:hypothetical protein
MTKVVAGKSKRRILNHEIPVESIQYLAGLQKQPSRGGDSAGRQVPEETRECVCVNDTK